MQSLHNQPETSILARLILACLRRGSTAMQTRGEGETNLGRAREGNLNLLGQVQRRILWLTCSAPPAVGAPR